MPPPKNISAGSERCSADRAALAAAVAGERADIVGGKVSADAAAITQQAHSQRPITRRSTEKDGERREVTFWWPFC